MNQRIRLLIVSVCILVFIAVGMIFFWESEAVNLTEGINPVNQVSSQHRLVLDSLKGKTPGEIKIILDRQWPSIGKDIASWLRSSGRIEVGETISSFEFFYGSGEGQAEDAEGNVHQGYFEEELIAKVIIEGRDEPMMVAVKCSNGMFGIQGELSSVTEDTLIFSVGRRKGLVDYVSYETAIHLAQTFGLEIYKGRSRHRRLIYPEEALRIDTDKTQVMVLVFPGDEFNLRDMTYNGERPS